MSISDRTSPIPSILTDKVPTQDLKTPSQDFNNLEQAVPGLWGDLPRLPPSVTRDTSTNGAVILDGDNRIVALNFGPETDEPAPGKGDSTQPRKPITKEQVKELIQQMNDDDYNVREKATSDVAKLGSAAYELLGEARRDNAYPEVQWRAERAEKAILQNAPTEAQELQKAHSDALDQVRRTGKISPETEKAYVDFIKEMDGRSMSDGEYNKRYDALVKKAYPLKEQDDKAFLNEQIAALKDLSTVEALHSVPAGDQARLDYADALVRSGENSKAVKILTEALKGNPALSDRATFKMLAVDSGAIHDSEFAAVAKSIARNDLVQDLGENKLGRFYNTIDHLSHESARTGINESLLTQMDKLLNDEQAKASPLLRDMVRKPMVEALTNSGRTVEATKLMIQMLQDEPDWVDAAWMRSMSRLNRSQDDTAFDQAVKEAKMPR